jgi:hypothetical protein
MTTKKPKGGQAGDARHARSAVSNGSKVLEGADGRTKAGRRYRDLINDFTAEIGGGDLTPSETTIVRNAAMAAMRGEELQAKMIAGDEDVSDEDCVRLGNLSSRAMRDLRDAKVRRSAVATAGMSPLDRVIAEIEAKRAAAPEPEYEDDEVEPIEPEPVWTPSEPVEEHQMMVADALVDEIVIEAPKPRCPVTIVFDGRPRTPIDPQGSTLPQLIGALLAEGYPPATSVTICTPAETLTGATLADAIKARNAAPLAARTQWFVK